MTSPNHNRRTFLQTAAGGMTAFALSPLLDPLLAAPLTSALNVGVIGIGRQGRSIVAELQKIAGVTVSAIADIDQSRLDAGLRRAQGAKGHIDPNAMLEDASINAVFIATPTHTHKDIAIAALQAGKHVYCEAPLAHTVEDCRAIAQAARGANTMRFAAGLQGRTNPIYTLAWSFVRSGSIRDIVSMRGQHFKKTSWRTPASDPARDKLLNWQLDPELSIGLAGEFGTQQFDVFHYFTRKYPISVRGSGSIRLHNDGRKVADTIACSMRFDDDTVLQYQASLANSYEDTHEVIAGTMGAVKLTWSHGWLFKEADAPTQGWEVYANRQQFHNEEGITLIADATQLASQGKLKDGVGLPNDSLYYSLTDFIKAIDESRPPACGAEEGMRATIVGILANQAITTGEEVLIDEALLRL
ncbi:MAG: Gfo/Idh/MocA family protein [Phycisphaerales bacterium]